VSLEIVPPFKVIPRLSGAPTLDADEISLRRLRDAVAGRVLDFPRTRAMALLLESDFPNKHRDFEVVLESQEELPEIRHLAALYLGKINTPSALEILIKSSEVRDEYVLAGVMNALGRIGDEASLDVVSRVEKGATGSAAKQARFAAALIAHRLGLQEHDLPKPNDEDYINVTGSVARPLPITLAHAADAEICLRSLSNQPFGIEFVERPTYQLRCGRSAWMILFNRDFADRDSIRALKERKALLGVVARRSMTTGLYSAVFIVLTSPSESASRLDILVHRTNGDLAFGGSAQIEGDGAEFSIRTASRPGAVPVRLEGTFENGRLDMKTALSAVFASRSKGYPVEELERV
jgi:hypothetical protein